METFTRDDLTFDVTDSGPADGEVVILLHGFPQDRTCWTQIAALLNAAGYRTLAPDQRGYSPGAQPDSRFAYSLRAIDQDTLALADAAGAERFHVVGHDWGGAAAWHVAQSHPDRVQTVTSLSTPHPAAMIWAMTHSVQALDSWYMLLFQIPWLPERLTHRMLGSMFSSTRLPQDAAQRYADRFATPESLTGPMGWYRSMVADEVLHGVHLVQRRLPFVGRQRSGPASGGAPGVRVPATYIWGAHDFALGRAAAEKTAEFALADYEFVELYAGHWLPETHAQECADAILRRIAR